MAAMSTQRLQRETKIIIDAVFSSLAYVFGILKAGTGSNGSSLIHTLIPASRVCKSLTIAFAT